MQVAATLRYARISPQKCRLVADTIRGKSVDDALRSLTFSPKKSARIVKKVLESAIANAEHNHGADIDELKVATGSVVNVSSIVGSRVHPFAGAAYATSKAALSALTREMASDFGPFGIRVNAISPGEIETSILSPGTEKIVAEIPMRRLGQPEEVAKAIYFLCTEQSSYITGEELHINGGQHV